MKSQSISKEKILIGIVEERKKIKTDLKKLSIFSQKMDKKFQSVYKYRVVVALGIGAMIVTYVKKNKDDSTSLRRKFLSLYGGARFLKDYLT